MTVIRKIRDIRSIRMYNKNNKKCTECGQPMTWFEGLLANKCLSMDSGRYVCEPCKLFHKTQNSRALMKGRRLSKTYNTSDFKFTDILHLPIATQLGILREIQHGKNGYLNKSII